MADIVKSNTYLRMVGAFADGDDRTLTAVNPKVNIGAAEINSLAAYIAANDILLGDKNAAQFTRIKKAEVVQDSTTYFDLTTD